MNTSILHKIRSHIDDLTRSEQKVARALLANYPSAGLDSVQHLAVLAMVSPPSVVRFTRQLGYEGFVDFQQALREELSLQASGPVQRLSLDQPQDGPTEWINGALRSFIPNLQKSLSNLLPYDLERAVALMGHPHHRLILAGGRVSQSLASYFMRNLQRIRPGVMLLPEPHHLRVQYALDARKQDVYVIFDFKRYQKDIINFGQIVAASGAAIILITDTDLSPIAARARVVFAVSTESEWPNYSFIPAIALLELLTAMVLKAGGDAAVQRMRNWDDMDKFNGQE